MTLTIDIPEDQEADIRAAGARGDIELLQRLLGDLATPVALALLDQDPLQKALIRLQNRTSQEIAKAQEEARAVLIPPTQELPMGKTLGETVGGTWPGDESPQEIALALRKLS